MKRFLHAFAMFACLALPLQMWAQELVYTLDGTQTGGNSGYSTESDITQDPYSWKVTGNTTMNPWRIGGKKDTSNPANDCTEKDRPIYCTDVIIDNISSIIVTHGEASSITVNSLTLIVSDNSNFSNPTSTIAGTFVASGTTKFERPIGVDWSNKYYKLVYNVTVSVTSNKFVQLVKVEFFKDASAPTATYSPESNATGVALNVQPTFTFDKAVQKADGSELTAADLVAPLLTFKDAGDNDVDFSATIDDAKKVITVAPSTELAGSTTYTLSLAALQGANGVAQTEANTFSFTTRDANAMSIDNIAPVKTRYIWGEVAKLTWETSNLPATATGAIQVYRDGSRYGDSIPVYDTASLTPGSPTFGTPASVNGGYALVPLSLPITPAQESDIYATNYRLVLTAYDGTTLLCQSEPVENITIIPTPAIETIREYLPAFNGDSLLTTGVVTAVNGTSFAIQGVGNQNSGLQVSKAKAQPTGVEPIAVGDSVAVLGVLAKDTYKLWKITDGSVVTRLASGKTLPAPIERSMAESLTPMDSVYFGMLVELSDEVTSLKGANGPQSKDIKADTLVSGSNKMVAYHTFMDRDVLKSHFVEGNTYRVRGVLSAYNKIAQICPRNAFDIAPAIAPVPEFAPANVDKVPLNTPITITFDRPMRKVGGAELTDADLASLIAFKDAAQDTAVLFAATICPSKDTIYIKPSVSLNGPIEYAVTIQPLEDYFGQAMATTTSSFTTLNPNSPHVENATIAAATRYLWGEEITVNFDAVNYAQGVEGYAVVQRDGVRVDSVVIADIAANEATFKLGSGIAADGDTYSTNYTIRVGSAADASATTAPFCVIATPTIQHLRQNFATYTDGDTVAVVGVVTGVGTWNTKYKNCKVTIQDGTEPNSGFYLYSATDSLLVIGDSIRAICKVTDYHTLHESDGAVKVEKLGTGNVPAPIELTISDASENKYQSMLVKIKNAKASETSSGWYIDDNTASMQVFGTFYQDFASNFTNGKTYDVIGAMGYYYDTKNNKGAAQIYPRMSSDIVEVTSTPSTPATPSAVAANTLSVKAYPNPFGNEIRVEGVDVRRVEIYNVVGQLVMQTNAVHDGVVSTANLRTGIYMVRFVDANGRAAVLKMSKR